MYTQATDPGHVDDSLLGKALTVLEQVANHVNEQKRVAFSIRCMANIEKTLVGRPPKFQVGGAAVC
jgi:hypothetical protein